MRKAIAELHIRALPYTWNSRRGVGYVAMLYRLVQSLGYVKTISRDGQVVGVVSGIGSLILTLVVDPAWQHRGIGKELIAKLSQSQLVYTNESVAPFYEKQGFIRVARVREMVFLWRK